MIATPAASTQLRDGVFRFLLGENSEKTKEKVLNYVYHQLGINISIVLLISLLVFTLTDIAYQWQSIGLLVTMALYEVYAQTVRGLGSNKLFVINGLLGTFAVAIFSILLVAVLNMGVNGIILSNIFGRLAAIAIIEVRTGIVTRRLSWGDIDWSLGKRIMYYSLPLLPTAMCWWIINSSNRFFIKYYCGFEMTGNFGVASKFSGVITRLLSFSIRHGKKRRCCNIIVKIRISSFRSSSIVISLCWALFLFSILSLSNGIMVGLSVQTIKATQSTSFP